MDNYQVMPPMSAEDYESLKADIAAHGVFVPIELDELGNVLDGHHRLKICRELGITDYPTIVRTGMTEQEKRTHARRLNIARRQMSREDIRKAIRDQLKETPEKSSRQIAASLGVSPTTVSVIRKEMEESGQVSRLDTSTGADGKQYPRQVKHKTKTESESQTSEVQEVTQEPQTVEPEPIPEPTESPEPEEIRVEPKPISEEVDAEEPEPDMDNDVCEDNESITEKPEEPKEESTESDSNVVDFQSARDAEYEKAFKEFDKAKDTLKTFYKIINDRELYKATPEFLDIVAAHLTDPDTTITCMNHLISRLTEIRNGLIVRCKKNGKGNIIRRF